MLSVYAFDADGAREVEDPTTISELVSLEGTVVWVDLVDPSHEQLAMLEAEFDLHPLALEDVHNRDQRPKLEVYPTHAFLVVYAHRDGKGEMEEIFVFLGPEWIVTVHHHDGRSGHFDIEDIRRRYARTTDMICDVGFLLYVILDEVVDSYFSAVDHMEEELADIEDKIFEGHGRPHHRPLLGDLVSRRPDRTRPGTGSGEDGPDDGAAVLGLDPAFEDPRWEADVQERILHLRRSLLRFRKKSVPLRDVVLSLLRGEVDWVNDDVRIYLQDVLDHLLRIGDEIDNQRELIGNAVDAHLALVSNRMNEIMKKMTSWGAILLGSTLIAGIYGMNFDEMPELRWRYGYFLALGSMLLLTALLYRTFKRRGWL